MARKLVNIINEHLTSLRSDCKELTPAMNNPKATPSFPYPSGPQEVSAGVHNDPGASVFDKPSINMTPIRNMMLRMPIMDA